MANGNGSNGVTKPKGPIFQMDQDGTITVKHIGAHAKWLLCLLGALAVSEASRVIVQIHDHERIADTRADLLQVKMEEEAAHLKLVKIDELPWRIGNFLAERERYLGPITERKKEVIHAEPEPPHYDR